MSLVVSERINNVANHVLKLYDYVSGLFDVNNANNKFSDIQIKIGNKIYYCHKFV